MPHSNGARSGATPKKPRFPLWFHRGSGQWAKKVRGRTYYFGSQQDAAVKEYMRVREDLEAGRTPRPSEGDKITLVELVRGGKDPRDLFGSRHGWYSTPYPSQERVNFTKNSTPR